MMEDHLHGEHCDLCLYFLLYICFGLPIVHSLSFFLLLVRIPDAHFSFEHLCPWCNCPEVPLTVRFESLAFLVSIAPCLPCIIFLQNFQ